MLAKIFISSAELHVETLTSQDGFHYLLIFGKLCNMAYIVLYLCCKDEIAFSELSTAALLYFAQNTYVLKTVLYVDKEIVHN